MNLLTNARERLAEARQTLARALKRDVPEEIRRATNETRAWMHIVTELERLTECDPSR